MAIFPGALDSYHSQQKILTYVTYFTDHYNMSAHCQNCPRKGTYNLSLIRSAKMSWLLSRAVAFITAHVVVFAAVVMMYPG